jgi:hypothetical protein
MPTEPSVIPINFARDNRWFRQLEQGDILPEEEMTVLWQDLVACYRLAQLWESTVVAVDTRLATLEQENARLTAALAEALRMS